MNLLTILVGDGLAVWKRFFILTLILPLAINTIQADDDLQKSDHVLTGNRFLIIAPDIEEGLALRSILEELYRADIVIKDPGEYIHYIDEEVFDAFVYLGIDYYQEPARGFFEDMERTPKPVLWIGYHGWNLDEKRLSDWGIGIHDIHNESYEQIESDEFYWIPAVDTTLIQSDSNKVLYWLHSPTASRIPGAVSVENFTFVAYRPEFNIFTAGFSPFLTAIRSVLGSEFPPESQKLPSYSERIRDAKNDSFRVGVHLPVYLAKTSEEGYGYEHDIWNEHLIRIKKSGAEWVSLVRTYFQDDAFSSTVQVDEQRTPTLESMKNIIRDAHTIGLNVQIILMLNLKELKTDQWHGMIRPKDFQQWWERYEALVLEIAEFSRDNEVEAILIGNEYASMQGYEDRWRSMIKKIREQGGYQGMLGYGVNFNAMDLAWSDALDFLGISAYWPLSLDRDPELETLNQAWQTINDKLEPWIDSHPLVRVEFTEAGYTSQPYSSVLPFSWKPHRGARQSLTEQLQSYRSLYNYLKSQPKIMGVHIFASTSEDNDPDSIGYTPFGKPAEAVVEQIMRLR